MRAEYSLSSGDTIVYPAVSLGRVDQYARVFFERPPTLFCARYAVLFVTAPTPAYLPGPYTVELVVAFAAA